MSRVVWGVDAQSQRVSIAHTDLEGERRGVHTFDLATLLRGGARLDKLYVKTFHLARTLARTFPPALVLVEQPSGARPNPELVYAVGVVIAAVFRGVEAETQRRVGVGTIPSATAKKVATGFGRRDKDEVLKWARGMGYEGHLYDESDAWMLAEAARINAGGAPEAVSKVRPGQASL